MPGGDEGITNKMAFSELLTEHIDNLQIEGELAGGKIDTTEKFEEFRGALRRFGFTFTTRSSRKENYSFEETDDGKRKKLPGRGSLMFKSSSEVSVAFFGYPFVVETTVYYNCSQGLKYYASKRYPDEMFLEGDPLAKRRRRPKTTQKIGCQARMTVKKIKVFNSEMYYVGKDSWREKKAAIDVLRSDLESGRRVESYLRYCVLISMDSVHNHAAVPKTPPKKKLPFNPAKKVLKLQEQFQEALNHLNGDLVTKCTNMTTLVQCCTNLKTIINSLKDSIERNDGVSEELMTAAMGKVQEKQLRCCVNAEKRAGKDKKRKMEMQTKIEVVEMKPDDLVTLESNENGQVIEIPGVLEGTPVIWDPVNVSWLQDGQSLVLQQDTNQGQRPIKPSILVQRRVEDGGNIGVVSQGGQNYTILQHSSIPNLGVSYPFTISKVASPVTSATSKKQAKRTDGNVTIAIPAGIDWNQQNWSQQLVVSDQFQSVPSQTVWNITQ